MRRSKPFSGKAKRAQLQEKRQQKRGGGDAHTHTPTHTHTHAESDSEEEDATHGSDSAHAPVDTLTSAVSKAGAANRWSTVFARENDADVSARRIAAGHVWDIRERGKALYALPPRPEDPVLTHPRGVCLALGAAEYARRHGEEAMRVVEERAFREWLENIYAKYPRNKLNHFEHNMEVWAQLWHTLATADVICIVADVRNPLWHLPWSLYEQVVRDLRKRLVIVLNKVDLVPKAHVAAWVKYVEERYGGESVRMVPFSSSGATMEGVTGLAARRRFLREARKVFDASHVSSRAYCVNQLLAACGAHPDAIADVEAKIQATARDKSSRDVDRAAARMKAILTDTDRGLATESDSGDSGDSASEARDEHAHSAGPESEDAESSDDDAALERLVGGSKRSTAGRATAPRSATAKARDEDLPILSEKSRRRRERKAKRAAKAAGVTVAAASEERADNDEEEPAQKSAQASAAAVGSARASAAPAPIEHKRPKLIVGMVGHPNAGKSSVINTVCADKRVSVSRTAGHTKRAQNVPVVDGIELLDCPGLIFPHSLGAAPTSPSPFAARAGQALETGGFTTAATKEENAERAMQELLGVVPIAQVREPFSAIRYLGEHLPIERMYGLTLPKDEDEWSPLVFAEALAAKRGIFIAKIGRPDAHSAGREVLYDSQDGVIPLAWLPPQDATAPGGASTSATPPGDRAAGAAVE